MTTSSRRVDLHCHSIFSDGVLTPEVLAETFASAGVQYASLTDHDTISGLQRFEESLQRLNIGFIPGVEITTIHHGCEVHVLGYGFDRLDNDLNALLDSVRQAKATEIQGVSHSIRKAANSSSQKFDGKIELARAIKVLHRAGGRAFLAHPFLITSDMPLLESKLKEFRELGMDGIEARYSPYPVDQQELLVGLARKLGFLVCGGSDLHDVESIARSESPIAFPNQDWIDFRNSLHSPQAPSTIFSHPQTTGEEQNQIKLSRGYHRRRLVLRIILPVLFTLALFISALWGLILPSFEQSLLDRKREMISELTNSAWSILATNESRERTGELTREEAQQQSITQISALRYGVDGKDYFWLQDFTPRIIMHPYRQDLIGQDVSTFQDPNGVRIFVEFANLVKRQNEGYVKYVWQWNDDPNRLEAKESFVKVFEPWGWIIGTGLYVEDVQQEIARIETRVVNISLIITGILVVLLLFIAYQGVLVESKRLEAERGQREATDKFRSLVEATTEGVLMVLGTRCRYANPMLLKILNLSSTQLELMDLEDILPVTEENNPGWDAIKNASPENAFEGVLTDSTGLPVNCAMTLNPIRAEGHSGFVITVKPLANALHPSQSGSELSWKLGEAVQTLTIGVFKSKYNKQAIFTEINAHGAELIGEILPVGISQPGLENLFQEHADFDQFLEEMHRTRRPVLRKVELIANDGRLVAIAIEACVIFDDQEHPTGISGSLINVSDAVLEKQLMDRQMEIQDSRLAFLRKPLTSYDNRLVTCSLETPIRELVDMMVSTNSSAVVVTSQGGTAVGIVTDRDLGTRILAKGKKDDVPVSEVMSAPVIRISKNAVTSQALILMEENGIHHLAVENEQGKVVNVVDTHQLIRFQDYGFQVIEMEVANAKSTDEVAQIAQQIPRLVKGLLNSAVKPQRISQLLSLFTDAAIRRFIELAKRDLGEPPCEFAFIAVGSLGREEPSLASDQDNAIIFEKDLNEPERQQAESYFNKLGHFVCEGLNKTGYAYCPGKIMANNPRWVLPLNSWITQFRHWVNVAEPEELLEFSIFFDLRCIYGSRSLVTRLLDEIDVDLKSNPIFYTHLAQNTLLVKPSPHLTGSTHLLNIEEKSRNLINLKDLLFPLVGVTRLYALYHGIRETNTIDRIRVLSSLNVIHPHTAEELIQSINLLNGLRFASQNTSPHMKQVPVNTIPLAALSDPEIASLKETVGQINTMQKKVSMDFLGGTQV